MGAAPDTTDFTKNDNNDTKNTHRQESAHCSTVVAITYICASFHGFFLNCTSEMFPRELETVFD